MRLCWEKGLTKGQALPTGVGAFVTNMLYIGHNGITDHIGEAQVAPYNLGLARLGNEIHILTAEKPGRGTLKQKYRQLSAEAGTMV